MRAGVRPNPRPQPALNARPHAQFTATLLDVPLTGRALLAYGSPSHRTRRLGPSGSRSLTRPTPNPATGPDTGAPQPRHPETAPAGATAPHPPGHHTRASPWTASVRPGAVGVKPRWGAAGLLPEFPARAAGPWGPFAYFAPEFPPPAALRVDTAGPRTRPAGYQGDGARPGTPSSTPNAQPATRQHRKHPTEQPASPNATTSVTAPLPATVPTRLTQTNRHDRLGVSTNRQGGRTDRPPPERKPRA
jgi:hypothetical protein